MTVEWVQALASVGQTFIGLVLVVITTSGLKQMRDSSKSRNDQLDRMEEQSRVLMDTLVAQTATLSTHTDALRKILETK